MPAPISRMRPFAMAGQLPKPRPGKSLSFLPSWKGFHSFPKRSPPPGHRAPRPAGNAAFRAAGKSTKGRWLGGGVVNTAPPARFMTASFTAGGVGEFFSGQQKPHRPKYKQERMQRQAGRTGEESAPGLESLKPCLHLFPGAVFNKRG